YWNVYKGAGKYKYVMKNRAMGTNPFPKFPKLVKEELSRHLHNTLFVDSVVYKFVDAKDIEAVAGEHITDHIIGNSLYRQATGIPQGSILSPILCNMYYSQMENERLGHLLNDDETLLIRLVDDFLFISLDKAKALDFLNVMSGSGNLDKL
ncbi:Telomerase reverse transcriptase, partial [Spiromyces aspiralis]